MPITREWITLSPAPPPPPPGSIPLLPATYNLTFTPSPYSAHYPSGPPPFSQEIHVLDISQIPRDATLAFGQTITTRILKAPHWVLTFVYSDGTEVFLKDRNGEHVEAPEGVRGGRIWIGGRWVWFEGRGRLKESKLGTWGVEQKGFY